MVDYGDAFARDKSLVLGTDGLLARGKVMVDAFNRIGLVAYTPGERDLGLGLATLRELAGGAKFRFLAANLRTADGQPVFESAVVEKLGDLRVGIIGLIGQRTGATAEELAALGVTITDPAAAAAAEAKRLAAEGIDLLLVLSHLGPGEENAVLEAAPEVRFFVGGHSGRQLEQPTLLEVGNARAWVVEAGSRGKYQGRLELFPAAGGGPIGALADAGAGAHLVKSIQQIKVSLENTRRQLDTLDGQPTPTPADENRRAARKKSLTASVDRLSTQLLTERAKLEKLDQPATPGALFRVSLLPIAPGVAEEPSIAAAITELKSKGLAEPENDHRLPPSVGKAAPRLPHGVRDPATGLPVTPGQIPRGPNLRPLPEKAKSRPAPTPTPTP